MDELPGMKRSAIGDGLRRLLDGREEVRGSGGSQTAMLEHRGRRHVVRLVNLSASGAMVVIPGDFAEGDTVMLQLLDHGAVAGQVKWARDGRIGIYFPTPLNIDLDPQ